MVFLLAACQSAIVLEDPTPVQSVSETIPPSPTIRPTEIFLPTKTAPSAPTQEEITEVPASPEPEFEKGTSKRTRGEIEVADGLNVVGTIYTPAEMPPPWPGVILLHMLWGDRSSWEDFAQRLTAAGYAVLAVDMRGHGETGGAVNWDVAGEDLDYVWDYFSARADIDDRRMAIIGASIGANMAILTGASEPATKTVVLLSLGLNYAGVKTLDPMIAYGERPVLIVASEEDTYAADSSSKLEEAAQGEARLVMYQDSGHGTLMLEREPGLGELIIDWLDEYLR